jgi:hypothetical protein
VGVVVHPGLAIHQIGNGLALVEERGTIFTEEEEFLIEEIIVNPANLAGGTVVRYLPRTFRSFVCIDRHAKMVKNVDAVP